LFPDNTTAFLAIDFDGSDWLILIQKVVVIAIDNGLFCNLERSKSGNGGHLWFFFSERLSAYKARQMGKLLLDQAGIKNRKTFDRMFPSQDEHTGKGYGNLICLPLQGKFVVEEKTVFITQDGLSIPNQWQYLREIRKIARQEVDKFLERSIKLPANTGVAPDDNLQTQENEEADDQQVATTQSQETKLVLGANIFIPNMWLPDKLYRYLKKELNFPNPDFYAKERFGYSTWQTSRFIKTLEVLLEGIVVPLGFLNKLNEFVQKEQLKSEITDQRTTTKKTRFPSKLILRQDQKQVLSRLVENNRVILEAQPGFGKTMVALALMKKLGQKTLIIVHTNTLLHQWQKSYYCLVYDVIKTRS